MKTSSMSFRTESSFITAGSAPKAWVIALAAIGLIAVVPASLAQPDYRDVPGVTVLTRGPVHEAFAGMIAFNPEPGVVVDKAPPGVIEEMPPGERPQGENITWIPGYWAWDDERSDFLWISGTWRALPPGRQWISGYWGRSNRGYQWISGYWADAAARATTYLPAPPASMEAGPNVTAPSGDYTWTPGCWIWFEGRYAWRPGYWTRVQADWDWIPAYYLWTPRGYIFVDGFWDYPVARRGVLFAPVWFEAGVYARRGYSFSPMIVISLSGLIDHLFLRPAFHHYYFGDYYDTRYSRSGFYASFSFQSSRYGYDPFYSRQRWEHRADREWERQVVVTYQNRRDNVAARPPRTWADQRSIAPRPAEPRQSQAILGAPIEQVVRSREGSVRFQPVPKAERQKLVERGREVQQVREQRQTLEIQAAEKAPARAAVASEPAQVQLPRSPILARPAAQMGRKQAPPQVPQAPRPDPRIQPRASSPGHGGGAPREQEIQPAAEQKESQPPAKAEPAAGAKAPPKPVKKGQDRDGKGKSSS